MEALITGFNEGDGEFAGTLGSLQCSTPSGASLKAGTGIVPIARQIIWNNQSQVVNTKVRIQFELIAESGKPLKPVITCLYAYEE